MATSNSDFSSSRHRHSQEQAAHWQRGQADGPAYTYHATQSQDVDAFMPSVNDEQAPPRPINVNPSETGSFRYITASQGARARNRESVARANPDATTSWAPTGYGAGMRLHGPCRPAVRKRQRRIETNRNLFIGLGVAAVLVMTVLGFMLYSALTSAEKSFMAHRGGGMSAKAQVAIDQNIEYEGSTYLLQKRDDGTYELARQDKDGSSTSLFDCSGEPVQLILLNGTLLVPENVGDGWDVLAYMVGASSVGSQVVDGDGNAIVGQGSIQSVEMGKNSLVVTDSTGAQTTVGL